MILGLKVDVCTYDGLRVGVPNLLRLFERHGVRASFFVAFGPDTSGRAVVRALRPGFLDKMRRTRAIRTYGLRTMLSGTLLPPRHLGGRLATILREVIAAGHELAVHGYDHRRWQDRIHRMDDQAVREEIDRAVTLYREISGQFPRGFGSACSPKRAKSRAVSIVSLIRPSAFMSASAERSPSSASWNGSSCKYS